MHLQISGLQTCTQGATCCITVLVVAVALLAVWRLSDRANLDTIPTAGSSTWLGSWWVGIKVLINATDVVQEGYDKYKGAAFKIPTFTGWMVVLSGRQHVEEFRKSRDDKFNFTVAAGDTLKANHTLGHNTHYNPYHIAILRLKLNRNLNALYADIKDEIVTAFDDILNLKGHEWKSIPTLATVQQTVSRTSNRAFVGLPLCRNPDWVNLNIQFTLDVMKGAAIIGLFPKFMAPFVARFLTNIHGSNRRGIKHLTPVIEGRLKHLEEYGASWDDLPNDLLTWFMEGSEDSQRSASNLTSRILAINFAAIHTSSIGFTHILYNLAANPQYIEPLREEVASVIKEEGWSKASVVKMHKIDSFIKETQRMNGVGLVNMVRKAMKDVILPDGTFIPKGTFVAMATQLMHSDNEFYDDAKAFDPFRFAKMRTDDSVDIKHQSTSTSPEYLVFGHGRHACPGRFFAASVLSTMLAHVVMTYDIKLKDGVTRPQNLHIGTAVIANQTAQIMLRRRAD